MSVGQMSVGQMSVGQMSVGQMSVGQMSVGQMSVGQLFIDQMTRSVRSDLLVYFPFVRFELSRFVRRHESRRIIRQRMRIRQPLRVSVSVQKVDRRGGLAAGIDISLLQANSYKFDICKQGRSLPWWNLL